MNSLKRRVGQRYPDQKLRKYMLIADILGPTILGEIEDVNRFSNVKKLVAFAGLDPVVSKI